MKDIQSKSKHDNTVRHRTGSSFEALHNFWRHPLGALRYFPFEGGFDHFPFITEEYPSLDISENDEAITVSAELPGVDPNDIEITVSQRRLTIKGEKKFENEEQKDDYHRIERSYGNFQRVVTLTSDVDEEKISATCKGGVLTLILPKLTINKTITIKVESED